MLKLPDQTYLQYTQWVYTTCRHVCDSELPMKATHYHGACSWSYSEKTWTVGKGPLLFFGLFR